MSTTEKVSINESIRASEVRAIGAAGENLGVISIREALAKAKEAGLDLIEISPNAVPPVVRITDYGKFKYELQKKNRETKSKAHLTETKAAQVKIGTGENDMKIKADRIIGWLQEGHRVKIDLFLWGRYKYMEFAFLKDRLERFLAIITEPFTIADEIKKSPKGLTVIIEKARPGTKQWTMPAKKAPMREPDLSELPPEAAIADEAEKRAPKTNPNQPIPNNTMTIKTNKAFTKRIKETRNGKLMVRAKGQNHFNAKESGQAQLKRKGTMELAMSNKDRGRFLQK